MVRITAGSTHSFFHVAGWLCIAVMLAAGGNAAEAPKLKKPALPKAPAGDWANFSKDGTPWKHPETGLVFPQMLEEFSLHGGFRDKRPEAGIALTYSKKESNLKADIVITPCPENLVKTSDVMAVARKELTKLADDLLVIAKARGYNEKQRSPVDEQKIPLWQQGDIPLVSLTLDLKPTDSKFEEQLPSLNQWLGVLIYHDYFIELNVVMPSAKIKETKADADKLITLIMQCIRFPALKPELLKVCQSYYEKPLTVEGRQAADSLLAYSKESPVFEVVLPGEALTATLDDLNAKNPDVALDLLRAFVVGSAVVALQDGTPDESFAEGARLMNDIRKLLKENKQSVESEFLDELAKQIEAGHAASFLREKMRATGSPEP